MDSLRFIFKDIAFGLGSMLMTIIYLALVLVTLFLVVIITSPQMTLFLFLVYVGAKNLIKMSNKK